MLFPEKRLLTDYFERGIRHLSLPVPAGEFALTIRPSGATYSVCVNPDVESSLTEIALDDLMFTLVDGELYALSISSLKKILLGNIIHDSAVFG